MLEVSMRSEALVPYEQFAPGDVHVALARADKHGAIDQAASRHHLCHQQNFRGFGYDMGTSNLPSLASAPQKTETKKAN